MKNDHLAIYLNDHLAGSVGALEILDRLSDVYADQPIGQFSRGIRSEVEADRDELGQMMKALGITESGVRKAGAWMGEKLSRAKIRLEAEEIGDPGLVLALETVFLGIQGKAALWRSLSAIQPGWPPLQKFDFARLQERAADQAWRTDEERVAIGRRSFRPE